MTFDEAEAELARRDFMICRNEIVTRHLASVGVEVLGLDMPGDTEVDTSLGGDGRYHRRFVIRPASEMQDGKGARYIPRWAWLVYTVIKPREKCDEAVACALRDPALPDVIGTCFALGGDRAIVDLFENYSGCGSVSLTGGP